MAMNVKTILLASLVGAACAYSPLAGCEKKDPSNHVDHADDADHQHKPGDGHDHDADAHDDHDHGPKTDLGEQVAGGFTFKASRAGELKPGGEVTIDLSATGGKLAAIRLWVGVEDAKGSIKAKGDVEGEGWHAHVELPDPMPEGAKLWVEGESDQGQKVSASFDLKM
jgi:hypothetical protein